MNNNTLIACLPDLQLYSLQIKPEIRFRAERLIESSWPCPDSIDFSYSTMQQLHRSGTRLPSIENDIIPEVSNEEHQKTKPIDVSYSIVFARLDKEGNVRLGSPKKNYLQALVLPPNDASCEVSDL